MFPVGESRIAVLRDLTPFPAHIVVRNDRWVLNPLSHRGPVFETRRRWRLQDSVCKLAVLLQKRFGLGIPNDEDRFAVYRKLPQLREPTDLVDFDRSIAHCEKIEDTKSMRKD